MKQCIQIQQFMDEIVVEDGKFTRIKKNFQLQIHQLDILKISEKKTILAYTTNK